MNKNPRFEESELAKTIGLLVISSSHLDYLLRHTLAVFIAEDITDNRIYDKAELIVTKFGSSQEDGLWKPEVAWSEIKRPGLGPLSKPHRR